MVCQTKYCLTPVYRCDLIRERSLKLDPAITGCERAKCVAREMLKNSPNEQTLVIMLNTKNKVIGVAVVTCGTLDASLIHPREFFRPAILANSASVIFAHNHPSGETTPSREDWAAFERLKRSGEIIGIEVLDSLIVGEEEVFSMCER